MFFKTDVLKEFGIYTGRHMSWKKTMDRVCGLRLGPNFAVRLAAENNFCLWLTVEKMHALAVFNYKYFRPYDCSNTNFTATDPKTEILNEIIEIQIIGIQSTFYYFLSDKLVCSQLIDLNIDYRLHQLF